MLIFFIGLTKAITFRELLDDRFFFFLLICSRWEITKIEAAWCGDRIIEFLKEKEKSRFSTYDKPYFFLFKEATEPLIVIY